MADKNVIYIKGSLLIGDDSVSSKNMLSSDPDAVEIWAQENVCWSVDKNTAKKDDVWISTLSRIRIKNLMLGGCSRYTKNPLKKLNDLIIKQRKNDMETAKTEKVEMDACINCGKETEYPKNMHIDYRFNYVEGAGQLCHECYEKIYKES